MAKQKLTLKRKRTAMNKAKKDTNKKMRKALREDLLDKEDLKEEKKDEKVALPKME